jgi:hypothetical protein
MIPRIGGHSVRGRVERARRGTVTGEGGGGVLHVGLAQLAFPREAARGRVLKIILPRSAWGSLKESVVVHVLALSLRAVANGFSYIVGIHIAQSTVPRISVSLAIILIVKYRIHVVGIGLYDGISIQIIRSGRETLARLRQWLWIR